VARNITPEKEHPSSSKNKNYFLKMYLQMERLKLLITPEISITLDCSIADHHLR
jgi:hypothetical protein